MDRENRTRPEAAPGRDGPILLALEGLDGSGKTVQARLLRAALERKGARVLALDFPRYDSFFGREIGRLLSGRDGSQTAMELDPKSMCLWYAADRWRTLSACDWRAYDYVLFNRYTLSNAVYQTARQFGGMNRAFVDWVFQLEHVQLGLPEPDLYFYLETTVEGVEGNVLKKEGRSYVRGADVYECASDLLARCRALYLELSGTRENIQAIPCLSETGDMLPPEKIGSRILSALRERGLYPR